MESVFDQFNLLQIPHADKSKPKLYFDSADHKRRVPKGIFPFSTHKRQVLEQPNLLEQSSMSANSLNDEFVKFER